MADAPFHNPFGALAHLRGERAPDAASEPAKPEAPTPASSAKVVPRAVVRLERKGRSGKDVTIVDHLGLAPIVRERWLKDLKAALGCGGILEGDAIVLQGDHRKRLPKLLAQMGVKTVSVSG